MSNSYIVELERLRAMLRDILNNKGIEVETDEPLNSLIPKVNAVGMSEIAALFTGADYTVNDMEGVIKSITTGTSNVISLNAPECLNIGNSVFYNNGKITSINLPKVTSIGSQAFRNTSKLREAVIGENVLIQGQAFQNSTALAKVKVNSATMQDNAFLGCTALTEVEFDTVSGMGGSDFASCTSLKKFSANAITNFSTNNTFNADTSLELIDAGNCTAIGQGMSAYTWLTGCSNLQAFVLRNGNCTLNNSAAFTTWQTVNNPDFVIYIPKQYIETYQEAAQWSNVSDYFSEIETQLTYLVPLGFDYEEYVEIVDEVPASPTKWKVYWIEKSRTAADVTYAQWFADDDGEGGIYVWDINDDITIPLEV